MLTDNKLTRSSGPARCTRESDARPASHSEGFRGLRELVTGERKRVSRVIDPVVIWLPGAICGGIHVPQLLAWNMPGALWCCRGRRAADTRAELFPGRFQVALGSGEALKERVTGEALPAQALPMATRIAALKRRATQAGIAFAHFADG
jgi:hypothetical protein